MRSLLLHTTLVAVQALQHWGAARIPEVARVGADTETDWVAM